MKISRLLSLFARAIFGLEVYFLSIITASAANCSLGTTNLLVEPNAGTGSITLDISPTNSAWTATTSASWLHLITSGGTSSTNVIFSFDANKGTTRTSMLTIAGQTATVIQVGSTYIAARALTTLLSSNLFNPYGLIPDDAGNVYIADTENNAIKKWTITSQILSIVVSNVPDPQGIAMDNMGNFYITDAGDKALLKWTATNNTLQILAGEFSYPKGLAIDHAGNVYIADSGANAIKKWTVTNDLVTTLVSGLNNPWGVALDAADNIYIANTYNQTIDKWTTANSNLATLISFGRTAPYPIGIAVDGSGNIYLGNTYFTQLEKWTAANGNTTALATSGFFEPSSLAVDNAGNLYIADPGKNAIDELPYAFIDASTKPENPEAGSDTLPAILPSTIDLLPPFTPTSDEPWLTVNGSTNGIINFSFTANTNTSRTAHLTVLGQNISIIQLGQAILLGTTNLLEGPDVGMDSIILVTIPKNYPWTATANVNWLHLMNQVGIGTTNIIFSLDANTNTTRTGTLTIAGRIVNITQAGTTYVAVGTPTTLLSSNLSTPAGVMADSAGNLYIANSGSNAIVKWTVADNSINTLISHDLNNPQSVALDNSGNIYIADAGNKKLLKWMPTNNILSSLATGFSYPQSVALDCFGNVYVADSGTNTIEKWTATNDSLSPLITGLSNPWNVAADIAGNLYIADTYNQKIEKCTTTGSDRKALVSFDGVNPYPIGIAVDGGGNVYIGNTGGVALEKWSAASGNLIPLVMSGFSQPNSLTVDGAGNIYIADVFNNAIKELPHAFVNPTAKLESAAAGSDTLPAVLPVTANLAGPFTPAANQSWLSINGVVNGIVSFSFTANDSPSVRTGVVNVLGQPIPVIQETIGTSPTLSNTKHHL